MKSITEKVFAYLKMVVLKTDDPCLRRRREREREGEEARERVA